MRQLGLGLAAGCGTFGLAIAGQTLLRLRLRLFIVPLVASIMMLTAAPTASAETWSGFVWQDTPPPGSYGTGNASCGYLTRDVNSTSGNGHPWLYTKGAMVWAWNGAPCVYYGIAANPGQLKVRQSLWTYRYDTGRILCNQGPEVVNTTYASYVETGYGWPSLACPWLGTNWYNEESEFWYSSVHYADNNHNGPTYTWVS